MPDIAAGRAPRAADSANRPGFGASLRAKLEIGKYMPIFGMKRLGEGHKTVLFR
jgi:hypothetical protein